MTGLVLTGLLLALPPPGQQIGLARPVPAEARPEAEAGNPARDVREVVVPIDGARIRALCTDGTRDVVLLHDADRDAESWRPVLERLDGRVGACAYDRRGVGGSGPAPGRRGWYELLDELQRIHRALGFERDYLMVGHGLGGLYARAYSADHPAEVGALLLLDPAHPELPARMRVGVPPGDWSARVAERARPNADGVAVDAVGARLRTARPPPRPITVVTPTHRALPPGWDARFVREATQQAHARILRDATMPRHIPAMRSGPDVPRDQPELVTAEILRLWRVLPD